MAAPKPKHDRPIERDASGAPIIMGVARHLVTLERMLRFRAAALVEQAESPQVLSYYAKEKAALGASIAVLRYHRATVEQLPEPLGLLRDITAAWDEGRMVDVGKLLDQARQLRTVYPQPGELVAPENDS